MAAPPAQTKTNFNNVNTLAVSIASHRAQLEKTDDFEEIDRISQKIATLERQMMEERRKELKTLCEKKEKCLSDMAALENTLDELNIKITAYMKSYKSAMASRLVQLETDVNLKKSNLDLPNIDDK